MSDEIGTARLRPRHRAPAFGGAGHLGLSKDSPAELQRPRWALTKEEKEARDAEEAARAAEGLTCFCAHCPDWSGALAEQKTHMRDVHGLKRGPKKNFNRGGFKKREDQRAYRAARGEEEIH